MANGTTSYQGPPDWMQPYLEDIFGEYINLYNNGDGFNLPDISSVLDFNDVQYTGFESGLDFADWMQEQDFAGQMGGAIENYLGMAGGDMPPELRKYFQNQLANGGPLSQDNQFQDYWGVLKDTIADENAGIFSQAGRYGSSAQAGALTDDLTDAYSSTALPYWSDRENRRLSAAGMYGNLDLGYGSQALNAGQMASNLIPQMIGVGLTPSQIYGDVGGQLAAKDQQYLDEEIARFNYADMSGWNALNALMQGINGIPTGVESFTPGQENNPWLTALGIGSTVAGIGQDTGFWKWLGGN